MGRSCLETMLRYLYLLSLLICIELSISYNYIEEPTERNLNKFGRNVRRDRGRKLRRVKERKGLLHPEYDYDRNPVEFDVASFIQPDEESIDDDESFKHRNKKRYEFFVLNNGYQDVRLTQSSSVFFQITDNYSHT